MVLWGTVVNAAAIVAGGCIGLLLPGIEGRFRRTIVQGIGIALCVLGVSMAMKTEHFLWMVVSLVVGGIIGEGLQVERRFEQAGAWLERRVAVRGEHSVGKGFVTASLVFCIGAMAVLGAIDSGARGNHDVLYAKSLMDGFMSIVFASTLGVGVLFSSAAVFLYQGAIALGAYAFASLLSERTVEALTVDVSAVGGVLIVGIGLNLLEVQKVNVANLLPAVAVMGVVSAFV